MGKNGTIGRVTIPTDLDVIRETKELIERWGADAIRDCGGTEYPDELKEEDAKVYATYYTTRKDNEWAKANLDEVQQMYIMTDFYTAESDSLSIHLMDHLYPDMLQVNTRDDIERWWEVIDRTTGEVVPYGTWQYDAKSGDVMIHSAKAFHEYTVSFLAYIMWDPVHMYNAVTNGWKDVEKQITFDVRQPKTHAYSMQRLRDYLESHPYVDVVRYTTFFHQFTLIFDEMAREKYVDWYGYSASVSPYILEQFEKEVGYKFRPEFIDYVESVCDEFRLLYENIKGTTPYCVKKVAVLNCWGKMRAWGNHMVHHAIYYKQNYSYAGIIEALSGAPFDVKFISFDDIRKDASILDDIDVILNVGDADTAYTGGENWMDPAVVEAVRGFVHRGGGLIGVGEPTAHQWQGRFIQLADVFGVECENGFNLNKDKYNWEEHPHFIMEDCSGEIDFGEGKKNMYALDGTEILVQKDHEVQMAVRTFGKGRSVYISGLPYSFENSRLLYRAVIWASGDEKNLKKWFSTNYNVEVHAYVKNGKYCVVNNTYEPQDTTVYRGDGTSFDVHMEANAIHWYEI